MISLVTLVKGQVKKTLKTEKDGFQWYELKENGFEGAADANGNILISLAEGYNFIFYFNGFFSVDKNGSCGICNIEGKEIISPSRGYKYIFPEGAPNNYPYFWVFKSEYFGVCDIDGNEIIPPTKENTYMTYYREEIDAFGDKANNSLGVKIDKQGHAINYLNKDGNEVIDFLFQSKWDFQYETGVLPDENNIYCSQFIIRFEFRTSSFIVRVLVFDRATGIETIKESYYISPSKCFLSTSGNEIQIGFDVQGTIIHKYLGVFEEMIDLVLDPNGEKYYRYRNVELPDVQSAWSKLNRKLNGCLDYRDEINFNKKFIRLKERLTSYSWGDRRY